MTLKSCINDATAILKGNGRDMDYARWYDEMLPNAILRYLSHCGGVTEEDMEYARDTGIEDVVRDMIEDDKTCTRRYAVDVHWDVAKRFIVDAISRDDAERIVREKIRNGEVCVCEDGFEATEDVEVSCSGEEGEFGDIEYF